MSIHFLAVRRRLLETGARHTRVAGKHRLERWRLRHRQANQAGEHPQARLGNLTMIKIVLLRHGQSTWNEENRFTGWTDVDLSRRGREEALEAGRLLESREYSFDCAYTSLLKRAIRTLWIVLDELDLMWIPVEKSWRLNERHYGALQGLNKAATAKRYSAEQVHLWRRSYDVPPPALTKDDKRHPIYDPRYKSLPVFLSKTSRRSKRA